MALEKADLSTINRYVRDVVNRIPPRPIKAHTIGTLTSDQINVSAPPVIAGTPQPKITTQALSLGPPPNPADGDIWIATHIDDGSSPGTRWQFQYNASSTSAYQWEFIGGPPFYQAIDAQESTSAQWSTVVDLTTVGPQYSVVRAGDYEYWGTARAYGSVAGGAPIITVGWYREPSGPWTMDTLQGVTTSSGASQTEMMTVMGRLQGVAAGSPLRFLYSGQNGGTNTFLQRRMHVVPIRIS